MIDLCLVSCLIDGGNNSWYEYPAFVPVKMANNP